MNTHGTKCIRVNEENPPPGKYPGKWGGYVVEVKTEKATYRVETVQGVRGIDIPCEVHFHGDGTIDVEI